MKLVYIATKKRVEVGDIAMTFRKEQVKVLAIRPPRHEGSTGRVEVADVNPDGTVSEHSMEFYPGVIDAEWVKCSP